MLYGGMGEERRREILCPLWEVSLSVLGGTDSSSLLEPEMQPPLEGGLSHQDRIYLYHVNHNAGGGGVAIQR